MAGKKPPVVQIFGEGHRGMIAVRAGDDAKKALMAYFAESLMPRGGKATVKGNTTHAELSFEDSGRIRTYTGTVCS